MLQCHFLELVLSKHFVVYSSVRTTRLVFHSQLRAICRTRFYRAAAYPKSVLVCGGCRSRRHTRDARYGALSPRVLRLAIEGKMMGFLDTLIIAFMTGGVSSLGTIAALKTDINWIKRVQRIRKLEIPNERTQVQGASTKRPT